MLRQGFRQTPHLKPHPPISNPPVAFPPRQRGWWYCDLVTVVDDGEVLRVDDMWIDVIVGPPDHRYRLLDLDDYGQATSDGRLSPSAADGLTRVQRFLDRRLNRRHEVQPQAR
ncbi:protein associated with RNAse G/E [Catenulispora sp. GAS73]